MKKKQYQINNYIGTLRFYVDLIMVLNLETKITITQTHTL